MNETISSYIRDIFDFILYPEFEGTLLLIKYIFLIISFVLLVSIIILLFINTWFRRFLLEDLTETLAKRPFGAKKTLKQWIKITDRLKTNKEDEYKLALIEADNMLDEVLLKTGYKGENIEERLKQLNSGTLPNIEDVLEAHKTRNNVVHDPDYSLKEEEIRKTLAVYEKAFQDLEML